MKLGVAGLPVAGVVWALNLLAGSFETPMGLVPLVFYCVAISAVVAQAVAYVSRPPAGVVETPRAPFQPISPAGAALSSGCRWIVAASSPISACRTTMSTCARIAAAG